MATPAPTTWHTPNGAMVTTMWISHRRTCAAPAAEGVRDYVIPKALTMLMLGIVTHTVVGMMCKAADTVWTTADGLVQEDRAEIQPISLRMAWVVGGAAGLPAQASHTRGHLISRLGHTASAAVKVLLRHSAHRSTMMLVSRDPIIGGVCTPVDLQRNGARRGQRTCSAAVRYRAEQITLQRRHAAASARQAAACTRTMGRTALRGHA